MLLYNIPDELIINVDQTPSRYVAIINVTMVAKREKHISRTGSNDKRSITLTLCESHNETILLFQPFWKGKTARSLPNVNFLDGFSLSLNKKHWSNENETIRLINGVLVYQGFERECVWSFPGPLFCFPLKMRLELGCTFPHFVSSRKSPYSVRMWKNMDQKNLWNRALFT